MATCNGLRFMTIPRSYQSWQGSLAISLLDSVVGIFNFAIAQGWLCFGRYYSRVVLELSHDDDKDEDI